MEDVESKISGLLVQKENHLLEIARLLACVDSKILSSGIRHALGLEEAFSPTNLVQDNPPTLFVPDYKTRCYANLCPNSEVHLQRAFGYLGDQNEAPLYLLDCLIGKKRELVAGLCFRTTEFLNGAVFLRGIWYRPRTLYDEWDWANPRSIFGKINSLTRGQADETDHEVLELNIHPAYPSRVNTEDLIVWYETGGCWEPAREFDNRERFRWVSEG